MVSQKNNDLKYCIKCNVKLTGENWLDYLAKRSNYICVACFKKGEKSRHKRDPNYNKKQLERYYVIKTIILGVYGNHCVMCGEDDGKKLTIDHIHKKKISSRIYYFLFDNFVQKEGYQILCYNCSSSKNIEHKDSYALRDKKKVVDHYGGVCAECQEDKIERLVLKRKNTNGAKRRHLTGIKFYRWIIKKGYPDNLDISILCHNCSKIT